MSRVMVYLAIIVTALFAPSVGFAVNCCSVNGGSCNIIPPLTHGQSGWTTPICGTTLSGTNCTAILDADASTSSATCITLAGGVTLDLNGHTLNCSSTECSVGAAVKVTSSGGSSAAVAVQNGDITGCWEYGIWQTGGTNTSVSDMMIDLAGSCTGVARAVGIRDVTGTIDHTVVKNALNGIELVSGEDVKSSLIRDNDGFGIYVNSSGSSLDNVLMMRNGYSIQADNVTVSMQRSELEDATTCHCYKRVGGGPFACGSITDCASITNSTTPSFVDDAITP